MLASIVDTKYMSVDENVSGTSDSSYGAIYAIQQIRFVINFDVRRFYRWHSISIFIIYW